jgi:hypothetical protein
LNQQKMAREIDYLAPGDRESLWTIGEKKKKLYEKLTFLAKNTDNFTPQSQTDGVGKANIKNVLTASALQPRLPVRTHFDFEFIEYPKAAHTSSSITAQLESNTSFEAGCWKSG